MNQNLTGSRELNILSHRSPGSVWDKRGWNGTPEGLTVTRWLIGAAGGAMAVQGLRQRSVMGGLLAGVGSSLAWWALTGEGDLPDARGWTRGWIGRLLERTGWRQDEDRVHEASAESFPASDAPSWTPTVGTTGHSHHSR